MSSISNKLKVFSSSDISDRAVKGSVGVCTIVAKNYLPQARTLMRSLKAVEPDVQRFVLLTDQIEDFFDPTAEDFTVELSSELPIVKNSLFHLKYTVLELCTAVKPFYLEHLFSKYGLEKLIYLDPDILVVDELEPVTKALDTHQIAITPHLTGQLQDKKYPGELDIIKAGSYNLGFIGLRQGSVATAFLRWWQGKLYNDCVVDVTNGIFVDQRWIDLVPGMFNDVAILRDPGLNLAYWNLPHRQVIKRNSRYFVNGKPLRFVHFSGFNPLKPEGFSKHQNRYTLKDLGQLQPLVELYRQNMLENGYEVCNKWPYFYARFSDGSFIPDFARRSIRDDLAAQTKLEGAFTPQYDRKIFQYLNEAAPEVGPGDILITRLLYSLYKIREDLQQAFPDLAGGNRFAAAQWFCRHAVLEYKLSEKLVGPVQKSLYRHVDPAYKEPKYQADDQSQSEETSISVRGVKSSAAAVSAALETTKASPKSSTRLNQFLLNWLNSPAPTAAGNGAKAWPLVTISAYHLYNVDGEAQALVSDPLGEGRVGYVEWLLDRGRLKYDLPELLLKDIRQSYSQGQSARPTEDSLAGTDPAEDVLATLARSIGGQLLLDWINSLVARPPTFWRDLTQLAYYLWQLEPSLHRRYDLSLVSDWDTYCHWFIENAAAEFGLAPKFIEPVRAASEVADFAEKLAVFDRILLDLLNTPVDDAPHLPLVTVGAYTIHQLRHDLKTAFPEPLGENREAFTHWFVKSTKAELGLHPALLTPLRLSLRLPLEDEAEDWPTAFVQHLRSSLGGNFLIAWGNRDYVSNSGAVTGGRPEKHLPKVSRVAYYLYTQDRVARKQFPDPLGKNRLAFVRWFIGPAAEQYEIPADFLEPMRVSLRMFELRNSSLAGVKRVSGAVQSLAQTSPDFVRLAGFPGRAINRRFNSVPPIDTRNHLFNDWHHPSQTFRVEAQAQPEGAGSADGASSGPGREYLALEPGLNIIGYLQAPTGVGEAARRMVESVRAVDLNLSTYTLRMDQASHQGNNAGAEKQKAEKVSAENYCQYGINLLGVNADRTIEVIKDLGPELVEGRYNIGYWYWELNQFPDQYAEAFEWLNEVWVATSFVQDAVAPKSPVPVVKIPPSIHPQVAPGLNRAHFGLPEEAFLFLTMFDMASVYERKNPLGVIEAFRQAFSSKLKAYRGEAQAGSVPPVGLVLKVNKGKQFPEKMAELRARIAGLPVYLIEDYLDQGDVNALTGLCDCTVSLHRSEGLGLTLAEAMYLGRPVIATAYSGNMDFTLPYNSFLVDYELVQLTQDVGPYPRGASWAEPDLDHAAFQMSSVFENRALREQFAHRGQQFIWQNYSCEATGEAIARRCKIITKQFFQDFSRLQMR